MRTPLIILAVILLLTTRPNNSNALVFTNHNTSCWQEDIEYSFNLKLNDEYDTYYNSSIERLMRGESSVESEVEWIIENFPELQGIKDTLTQCLDK